MNTEMRIKNEDRRSLAMVAGPDGLLLRLPCGLDVDEPQVQHFVQAALDKLDVDGLNSPSEPMSRDDACELVERWADQIAVKVENIRIRPMTRKWASCSSRGTLTLASDLLDLPRELVEYVICHDLVHLRVPDHGKGFRAMMNGYMSDWKERESRLAAWIWASDHGTGTRGGETNDRHT